MEGRYKTISDNNVIQSRIGCILPSRTRYDIIIMHYIVHAWMISQIFVIGIACHYATSTQLSTQRNNLACVCVCVLVLRGRQHKKKHGCH